MLAAALTIWAMFSLWLIADVLGWPRPIRQLAMRLLCVELVTLAVWSYGTEDCGDRRCAPLAQAAGIAARTDVPFLAGAFLVVTLVRLPASANAR